MHFQLSPEPVGPKFWCSLCKIGDSGGRFSGLYTRICLEQFSHDLLQLSGCAQLLHLAFVGVEVLGVSIERRKSLHNSRSILINVYVFHLF